MLADHLKPVKVLTIDKAQGIDCDIVIISCTKQTSDKGVLLRDFKRLNVAITRAKKKLVLIGTHKYLTQISPLDEIIAKIDKEGWTKEITKFDDQMKSYLPVDYQKFISIV